MSADGVVIRPSREGDVAQIAAIYGYHVLHGLASFEEVPPDIDELASRRRDILARGLPYLVAERSGRVIGYCYAGPYRTRSAYRFTVEDSIYVDEAEVGRGLGRALLATLLDRCAEPARGARFHPSWAPARGRLQIWQLGGHRPYATGARFRRDGVARGNKLV